MTTTKTPHTPGPWEIRKDQKDRTIVFKPYVGTIAETYGQDLEVCEANAAVILCAPDLLEILAPFIEIWARGGDDYKERMDLYWGYDNLSKARAAIAKATGAA